MEHLDEAICDYIDSCHRGGYTDDEDNIKYFLKENAYMNLDKDEVRDAYYEELNSRF